MATTTKAAAEEEEEEEEEEDGAMPMIRGCPTVQAPVQSISKPQNLTVSSVLFSKNDLPIWSRYCFTSLGVFD